MKSSDYSELIFRNEKNTVGFQIIHWDSDSYTSGVNIVSYSYPYNDGEYIEYLGQKSKRFVINAFIYVPIGVANTSILDSILTSTQAFEVQLPLPYNGKRIWQNMVLDGTYSINRSAKRSGAYEISIPIVQTTGRPQYKITANKGIFDKLSTKIFGNNESVFSSAFNSLQKGQAVYQSAVGNVQEVSRGLRRASQVVSGSVDGLNVINSATQELIASADTLVRTPATLASKVSQTFNNFKTTFTQAKDLFEACKSLSVFSLTSNTENNSTTKLQQQNNAKSFEKLLKGNALALQYQASANINYTTQDELFDIQNQLQNSYNALVNDIRGDRDLYNSIQEARLENANLFQGLSVSLPKISTKRVTEQSLTTLCYSLYGNLDNVKLLSDLNNINDNELISGNIKIISNV